MLFKQIDQLKENLTQTMRCYPDYLPIWIDDSLPPHFPPTHLALDEPDGLLAVGVEALTPEWMLKSYALGIFPWSGDDEPITWWTPNPRAVLFTDQVKVSKSLRKTINSEKFTVSFDQAFLDVVKACATTTRPGQDGTWIRQDMQQALLQLHQTGNAHSVEVWHQDKLVGGLYGLSVGQMFFGESMFALMSDASKVALVALCQQLKAWSWPMIDCQMETDHLKSLGATTLPREEYEAIIQRQTALPADPFPWKLQSI